MVLDVGAGLGFLTHFTSVKCKRVVAVEADSAVAAVLREQLVDVPNVRVVEGDILKTEIPCFNKVVSIPPYQISSSLLLWLFEKGFDDAVLVFQKEFAERLVAPVGSEDYSWLTVVTYYNSEADLLDEVPRSMFYPQPQVDSVIVHLKPKKPRPFHVPNERLFKQFVQSCFVDRNRKVKNAILSYMKATSAKSREKPFRIPATPVSYSDRRVRELSPNDFGVLADAVIR
jgi:16S rRNA (adenine1518-N6/adenine1519-N6)-dimethyltransferase